MKALLIIFLTSILLLGCASTKLTSFVDPDFTNSYYHKILIYFPSLDLDEQKEAEDIYKECFAEYGLEALSSTELFPPTRSFSSDEMIDVMKQNKVEAVLFVEFKDAWNDETYIPETQTTNKKGDLEVYGNRAEYKEKSTTYSYGGYYVNKPRIKFESRLVDLNMDKIAWIGSSLTKGNAFAKFHKLISSLAESTLADLKKNNLVTPKPR